MLRYKKVLVLLDLTEDSEQVLLAAREVAENSAADMVLLHVVEFAPVEPVGETLVPTVQIDNDLLDRCEKKLTQLAQRHALPRARLRVEAGHTKTESLRAAAQESADLIVLGSRERHGLAILVNLTEDTVLHAAHCDVLAVRLKARAA
jgi:universal stress protein A